MAAAAISIVYLRKQIDATAVQESARRARRLMAARSRLPLQLSEVVEYASEAITLLKRILDAALAGHRRFGPLAELQRPVLPEQAILALSEIIENTEHNGFANLLGDMISQMQVLNSRLRGFPGEARLLSASALEAYLLNAAKIYGYAGSMYEYARREVEQPPIELDWQQAIGALRASGLDPEDYPTLHAFVGRARDRAVGARQTTTSAPAPDAG